MPKLIRIERLALPIIRKGSDQQFIERIRKLGFDDQGRVWGLVEQTSMYPLDDGRMRGINTVYAETRPVFSRWVRMAHANALADGGMLFSDAERVDESW